MKTKEIIKDDFRTYREQINRDGRFLKGQLVFSLMLILVLLLMNLG